MPWWKSLLTDYIFWIAAFVVAFLVVGGIVYHAYN